MQTARIFEVETVARTLVVSPLGDVSSLDERLVLGELRELLERLSSPGMSNVLIDLKQAPFFGSTMLGAIVKLWRAATAAQGKVALCNVSAGEHDVLAATRFDSVWSVYPTRDAALAALQST